MFWLGAAMSIPTGIVATLLTARTARILRAALSSAVALRTTLICYEVDDAYRTLALPGTATLSGLLAATLAIVFLSTGLVGTLQLDLDKLLAAQPMSVLTTKILIFASGAMGMAQLIRLFRMFSASRYPVERMRGLFRKAATRELSLEVALEKWGYEFHDQADGFRWMGLTGYGKHVPVCRTVEAVPRPDVTEKSAG